MEADNRRGHQSPLLLPNFYQPPTEGNKQTSLEFPPVLPRDEGISNGLVWFNHYKGSSTLSWMKAKHTQAPFNTQCNDTSSFPTFLISAQRKQAINPEDAEEQMH